MAGDRAVHKQARGSGRPGARPPRPLDRVRLDELALAYVARFATSAAKLERYLVRKLRERGWEGEDEPDLGALVERLVELGYVDDRAFAQTRSGSLLRRGYGPRRIGQALGQAGIAEDIREDVRPNESTRRSSALAMARKRRFGPFGPIGSAPLDRPQREKQIAALLRAGHMLADARALIDAPSEDAAVQWAAEGED